MLGPNGQVGFDPLTFAAAAEEFALQARAGLRCAASVHGGITTRPNGALHAALGANDQHSRSKARLTTDLAQQLSNTLNPFAAVERL